MEALANIWLQSACVTPSDNQMVAVGRRASSASRAVGCLPIRPRGAPGGAVVDGAGGSGDLPRGLR
eukprot:7041306-Pyramimonas_sp.AAC.1